MKRGLENISRSLRGNAMVISLGSVVQLIVFLLVAAGVFALLYWLIEYIGSQVGEGAVPFIKVAKVVLVVCGILILISMLLSFVGVIPGIRFTQ